VKVIGTPRYMRLRAVSPAAIQRSTAESMTGSTGIEWHCGAINIPSYFTAPNVNPCTRYRCKAANTTATGSVASKVAAIT
jgi:hypothetical protein